MSSKASFLGITANVASKDEVLYTIDTATAAAPIRIATLNPEFILAAQHNQAFVSAIAAMTECTIDGTGLMFYLKLCKQRLGLASVELYHGADMIEDLFRIYSQGSKSFFFLGGMPGAMEASAASLKQRYPQLAIVGAEDGGVIDSNAPLDPQLIAKIMTAKPDILLVGFGAPQQELWITKAAEALHVPVMVGIGGALTFYSQKKRAPAAMRSLHLEWLWRSLTEKGHLKRAFRAVVIFPLVALWKTLRGV